MPRAEKSAAKPKRITLVARGGKKTGRGKTVVRISARKSARKAPSRSRKAA